MLDPLNPLTWIATASHIRSLHPDALIVPWWEPYWAPSFASMAWLVRRAGVRVVFVCHNLQPHEPRIGAGILSRMALRQGDGYVVQSADDEQKIKALVSRARIQYVPHPIYPQGDANPIAHAVRREGTAELLFFGFVRPYKGLRVLLDALPAVLEAKPVHLTVAGEFWEKPGIYEQMIRDLGIQRAVTLLDRYLPDEELSALFAQGDLVVLPYTSVTSSAALGLAIGHGVPVVVSDVGDLGKIVRQHSVGDVAEPGNSKALASAIMDCLEPSRLDCFRRNADLMRRSADLGWQRLVDAIEELAKS